MEEIQQGRWTCSGSLEVVGLQVDLLLYEGLMVLSLLSWPDCALCVCRNQVGALLDCCWLVMRSASSQAQVSFAWMLLEYVMVPALEFAPNEHR